MRKIVDAWRRETTDHGYRYVTVVQVDLSFGTILIQSWTVGPKGGYTAGTVVAFMPEEWREVNDAVNAVLAAR